MNKIKNINKEKKLRRYFPADGKRIADGMCVIYTSVSGSVIYGLSFS